MNHDRAFKILLTTYFVEFVEAFLPDVRPYLDTNSLEFIDKEIFADLTAGDTHQVDVLVKTLFRGRQTFFLLHVENQATARPNFPKRMFTYFARLHEKYDLPIYPVVIFSCDKPLLSAPDWYEIVFPNKKVLIFDYTVIQLNRLDWRNFVQKPNPAAAALMAKMQIAPQDRVKVRLECLRLIRTLKLDLARSKMIGGFVDAYLKLTTAQFKEYLQAVEQLAPQESEEEVEIMSYSERIGRKKGKAVGLTQGRAELLQQQIEKRFEAVSPESSKQIGRLSLEQLDELGVTLFDFITSAEIENWLAQNAPKRRRSPRL